MKYAVCNELFINHSFRDSCHLIAKYGFTGIEIAPYIIAKNRSVDMVLLLIL